MGKTLAPARAEQPNGPTSSSLQVKRRKHHSLMGQVLDLRRLRAAYEAVVAATSRPGELTSLGLLAIPSLRALNREADLEGLVLEAAERPVTQPGVREAAHALARGEGVAPIAARFPQVFGDLDGTLLVKALSLPEP